MLVEVVMEARWTPWFPLDKTQRGHTHGRSLRCRQQASHEGLDGPTGREKLLAKVTSQKTKKSQKYVFVSSSVQAEEHFGFRSSEYNRGRAFHLRWN